MFLTAADITKQCQVAPSYYLLEFTAKQLALSAKPGQFVHVKCSETQDPLLRRPISIHRVNREKGTVSLLYRAVGRGTKLLAAKKPGESLDILGPLGNGFQLPPPGSKVAIVAGGIGIAPLFFLTEELIAHDLLPEVFFGARSSADLPAKEQITALGVKLFLATDDGSAGRCGSVTELLAEHVEKFNCIYACGPYPMMKKVAEMSRGKGIALQVSLEERMGCGVGACLACSCKIKTAQGNSYKRVCTDGPVFNAEEVVWYE